MTREIQSLAPSSPALSNLLTPHSRSRKAPSSVCTGLPQLILFLCPLRCRPSTDLSFPSPLHATNYRVTFHPMSFASTDAINYVEPSFRMGGSLDVRYHYVITHVLAWADFAARYEVLPGDDADAAQWCSDEEMADLGCVRATSVEGK